MIFDRGRFGWIGCEGDPRLYTGVRLWWRFGHYPLSLQPDLFRQIEGYGRKVFKSSFL
jgi:hypothetical protein